MPAYYSRSLRKFLSDSTSTIIGELAQANSAARFPLTPEAIDAWRDQLPPLTTAIRELTEKYRSASEWQILLEYPIPMVGRRIDAVLLASNLIIVIETKTGNSRTSAARQVEDYALSLACFHEGSAGRKIVPLVIATGDVAAQKDVTAFDHLIEPSHVCSVLNASANLLDICNEHLDESSFIDPIQWDNSRFKPIPPIIDAAVALYSGMDVFEIGHSCSAREDLNTTTEKIVSAVGRARSLGEKIICFVTGVPGAGKTLVGLNAVHRPEIRGIGSFLSGNGPLVNVIQEGLIRDVTQPRIGRGRVTRREAELEVRAFIHNVHRFADEYYSEDRKCPAQKVIVFDEAQRAWDAEQNERAKRPPVSESEMMIEVMDRHQDWSVIVALIGGGQEINRGEAGLAEWGRALVKFPHWQILASPFVLSGCNGTSVAHLFEDPGNDSRVQTSEELHLRICTRSIRAQRISDWVDAVLSGAPENALKIATLLGARPILTRSLSRARLWLENNRRGSTRSGLVASAYAARLRADGLESSFEFHRGFEWEHWFLDTPECVAANCDHKYCNDVRASSKLEVVATQFEIQGLELDWVGVCWGEDFLWEGDQWECRRFNNKKWRALPADAVRKRAYSLNAYRVLLTRARQNMVLYIPRPDVSDETRLHDRLDRTADFLLACGAETFASGGREDAENLLASDSV